GMFAFAIWDRETDELFAARDQIGVKPLYYAFVDGFLVIGSEMRTVMDHPAVPSTLSAGSVVEYLSFGYTSGERTLIESIKKLEPGHAMRLSGGRLNVFEYWDVIGDATSTLDGRPVETQLRELLEAAVSAALVSDVPVGIMLSGGLDSSVIAALAARHGSPDDLHAFSIDFGLPTDESAAAARLADELGISHTTIRLTQERLRSGFDAWLGEIDEPSSNPTWFAVAAIAEAARDEGIKVLIGGDGGDELFGGYNRWMKYLRFHDRVWGPAPRSVRRVAGALGAPVARGLAGDIVARARKGGELFVNSRAFHDDHLKKTLGPVGLDALAQRSPEAFVAGLRARFDERCPGGDYLNWMSYVALKTDLVEDYLARLDKMGMIRSVEGRVPLLDPALARFAFGLTQEQKIGPYEQKRLFRRVVTPLLPGYITERPKQGFCPPVSDWATQAIADRSEDLGILQESGIVRGDAAVALAGPGGSFARWTLGTLAAWCRQNL
ncbi:MAG: asparagine synthase (glutamine-hydrolyzing), partial [Actinomycetota bacterium]